MHLETHGSFAPFVRAELESGQSIFAEASALMSHESSVDSEVFVPGGVARGLLRKLAGSSFFLVKYSGPGAVMLSKNFAGDLVEIDLDDGREVRLQHRAFLMATSGVEVSPELDLSGAVFNGGPFPHAFTLGLSGPGKVIATGWGDVHHMVLGRGESVVCAEGKIMAMERSVRVSGLPRFRDIVTGRRVRVEGPGDVWLQSRDFDAAHPKKNSAVVVDGRGNRRKPRPKPEPGDRTKERWIWDGHR